MNHLTVAHDPERPLPLVAAQYRLDRNRSQAAVEDGQLAVVAQALSPAAFDFFTPSKGALSLLVCTFLLVALPLLADDTSQILSEFQKTQPGITQVHVVADHPFLVAVSGSGPGWERGQQLGVFARRDDHLVPITVQTNKEFPTQVWVQNQGPDSITLGLADPNYGRLSMNLEIFYDPKTFFPKRIVQFAPVHIHSIRAAAGVITLTGSDGIHEFTMRERNDAWQVSTGPEPANRVMTPPFKNVAPVAAMPVSTIAQFEEARPDRDRHVPSEAPLQVDEKVGPYQREGKKIWVGKTFYDAGGSVGIGDIGYYDDATGAWTFLHIRQMADWSTSALLVEPDTVYAGLVRYSESSPESGGLLRYNLATKQATVTPLPDVIERIMPFQGKIYCGTIDGFSILDQNGSVRRFTVMPKLDGTYAVTPVT